MVKPKVDLVTIDNARINEVCRLYFLWKDLNVGLKSVVSRGINFPEAISEPIGCYTLGYKWNKGSFGDARSNTHEVIEMKATSNFDSDLTSFSPSMEFDKLIFLRLDATNNQLHVYDTGLNDTRLGNVQVNSTQTLKQQQDEKRRPRFSIINLIIKANNLQPVAIFDIRTMQII